MEGVGYRFDVGQGVPYNPFSWVAGNLADQVKPQAQPTYDVQCRLIYRVHQAASNGQAKVQEKSKAIGLQVKFVLCLHRGHSTVKGNRL